MKIGASRNYV